MVEEVSTGMSSEGGLVDISCISATNCRSMNRRRRVRIRPRTPPESYNIRGKGYHQRWYRWCGVLLAWDRGMAMVMEDRGVFVSSSSCFILVFRVC